MRNEKSQIEAKNQIEVEKGVIMSVHHTFFCCPTNDCPQNQASKSLFFFSFGQLKNVNMGSS